MALPTLLTRIGRTQCGPTPRCSALSGRQAPPASRRRRNCTVGARVPVGLPPCTLIASNLLMFCSPSMGNFITTNAALDARSTRVAAALDDVHTVKNAFKRFSEVQRILVKYDQLLLHDVQSKLQQRGAADKNILCGGMDDFTDRSADIAGEALLSGRRSRLDPMPNPALASLLWPACMCCVSTEQHGQSSRAPSSARDAVYVMHGRCCAHRPRPCALPHVLCRGVQTLRRACGAVRRAGSHRHAG